MVPPLVERCCCCNTGHLPGMLNLNAALRMRSRTWDFVCGQYVIDGYHLIDHDACTVIQLYDLRKVLVNRFVHVRALPPPRFLRPPCFAVLLRSFCGYITDCDGWLQRQRCGDTDANQAMHFISVGSRTVVLYLADPIHIKCFKRYVWLSKRSCSCDMDSTIAKYSSVLWPGNVLLMLSTRSASSSIPIF